jgi:hypothetical protein
MYPGGFATGIKFVSTISGSLTSGIALFLLLGKFTKLQAIL